MQTISNQVVIYQLKNGALELKADVLNETIWLSQDQIAELFGVQKAAISKHIKNIFVSDELKAEATVSKMETVQNEGRRRVKRTIDYYNLDLVLSIGYRVNSRQATQFRQWASKVLKSYIVAGYALNKQKIKQNHDQFLQAVESVKNLLPTANSTIDNDSVLELIKLFADTWFSLDAYDKDKLIGSGTSKKKVKFTAAKLQTALAELKFALLAKNEATDIFGRERMEGALEGIVGNIMQSFGEEELYPTVEEKAAHLLYFIIKNHPFVDGNKRCGAYAFIWFLRQTKILDTARITPPALTALTLLIAESNPKDKVKMVGLICTLLKKPSAA